MIKSIIIIINHQQQPSSCGQETHPFWFLPTSHTQSIVCVTALIPYKHVRSPIALPPAVNTADSGMLTGTAGSCLLPVPQPRRAARERARQARTGQPHSRHFAFRISQNTESVHLPKLNEGTRGACP